MYFNRLSEEIIYKIQRKEMKERVKECFYAYRRDRKVEEVEDYSRFGKLETTIRNFVSTFKESFPQSAYTSMLYLLNNLTIEEEEWEVPRRIAKVSLGQYDSRTNTITLRRYSDRRINGNLEETLIHELMHMASTRKIREGYVTGFEIPDVIGYGLSEGYTQYLTEKYFTKGSLYTETNDDRVFFAKGIENIIGADKMEAFFFDGNIGEVIRELSKYSSREDVMKLLFLMDRLNSPLRSAKDIQIITKEIARMNHVKLQMQLQEGTITQEQYDIEHAIKVEEYRRRYLWSEQAKIIKDQNCFIIEENEWSSNLYPFTPTKEKPKEIEKKYQE